MLMDKDLAEIKRRLGIIKDQVRKGLQKIRQAVHAIKVDKEYENFPETVQRLMEQVRSHTKINVDCSFDDIEEAKTLLLCYHNERG